MDVHLSGCQCKIKKKKTEKASSQGRKVVFNGTVVKLVIQKCKGKSLYVCPNRDGLGEDENEERIVLT